jgi:hypothetical protein
VTVERQPDAPRALEITPEASWIAILNARARRVRFRSRVFRRPIVALRHRGLVSEDAFIVSYPRSGTTWLRFLLCESIAGEAPAFGEVRHLVPYVGHQNACPAILGSRGRLIQSHERHKVGMRKVVYIVRNPLNVVVSEYRWQQRIGVFEGSFERFFEDFLEGRCNPWGGWDQHVNFWTGTPGARAGLLHVLRYEDLRADPRGSLTAALEFLEIDRTPAQVARAVAANSLESMRRKEESAPPGAFAQMRNRDIRFVNRGSNTSWRDHLRPADAERLESRWAAALVSAGYSGVGSMRRSRTTNVDR